MKTHNWQVKGMASTRRGSNVPQKEALQKEAYRLAGLGRDIADAADRIRMFADRVAGVPTTFWDGELAEIKSLVERINGQTNSLNASAKLTQRRYNDLKDAEGS